MKPGWPYWILVIILVLVILDFLVDITVIKVG